MVGWLTTAFAQANYRDVPLGGRTALMGNTGTAAGDDSAMPFLNPAGIAAVPGTVLSLSTTVHTFTALDGEFFHPRGFGYPVGPEESSLTTSYLTQLPSSLMYMTHLVPDGARYDHTLALSLVSPTAHALELTGSYHRPRPDVAGQVSEVRSLSIKTSDQYYGLTYGFGSPAVRLGVSAFALVQQHKLVAHESYFDARYDGALLDEASTDLTDEHRATSAVVVLGGQWTVARALRLGAGVALPSVSVWSHRHRLTDVVERGDLTERDATILEASSREQRPLRVNAGLALGPPDTWTLAVDGHWYAPRAGAFGHTGVEHVTSFRADDVARDYYRAVDERLAARGVLDASIGGEWITAHDLLALRAGVFTNTSPEDHLEDQEYSMVVDRVGGSLGAGLKLGVVESSAGVVYQRGSGRITLEDHTSAQALATHDDLLRTAPFVEHAIMFVLAGAVTSKPRESE